MSWKQYQAHLVYIKLESGRKGRDYGETLNKIVTKILNFILKIINSSSPKAQDYKISTRINTKETTSRHIIIKYLKTKENILKTMKAQTCYIKRNARIIRSNVNRKHGNLKNIQHIKHAIKNQPRILYPEKTISIKEMRNKTILNFEKAERLYHQVNHHYQTCSRKFLMLRRNDT